MIPARSSSPSGDERPDARLASDRPTTDSEPSSRRSARRTFSSESGPRPADQNRFRRRNSHILDAVRRPRTAQSRTGTARAEADQVESTGPVASADSDDRAKGPDRRPRDHRAINPSSLNCLVHSTVQTTPMKIGEPPGIPPAVHASIEIGCSSKSVGTKI